MYLYYFRCRCVKSHWLCQQQIKPKKTSENIYIALTAFSSILLVDVWVSKWVIIVIRTRIKSKKEINSTRAVFRRCYGSFGWPCVFYCDFVLCAALRVFVCVCMERNWKYTNCVILFHLCYERMGSIDLWARVPQVRSIAYFKIMQQKQQQHFCELKSSEWIKWERDDGDRDKKTTDTNKN